MAKVNEQKHLGLILDSGLSFEKHRNEKGKEDPPLKTLDQMYKALEYCVII